MLKFLKFIPITSVLLLVLLGFSSCNKNFNQDELNKVKAGDKVTLLKNKVGEATNQYHINKWVIDGNSVYINKKSNKVENYFIENPCVSCSENEINQLQNTFLKIRIGMEVEEVEELIGKPDSIIDLNVFFYNSHQRIITHKGVIESVDLHVYQDLSVLDKIRINFNGGSMHLVNIALAIIMFGIALEIKIDHFKQVIKHPKSILVGIFSQFFALPALTFLLIVIIKPTPSVAMGLILVAASPGGNISNFMTSMAKGNSALSVSLTAVATVASVFMTPANFTFWGNLYSETSESMIPIQIDALQMTQTVILILGIPIALGIVFGHYFEKTTAKIVKPLKIFSIVFFIILIVGALVLNLEFIVRYLHLIALLVLVHNFIALATGYSLATIFKLPRADRRTITIETGIQNSGLALVLIFNPKLFDGLGGMAFIAAWWGIWHIISGLIMSTIWRRRKL